MQADGIGHIPIVTGRADDRAPPDLRLQRPVVSRRHLAQGRVIMIFFKKKPMTAKPGNGFGSG